MRTNGERCVKNTQEKKKRSQEKDTAKDVNKLMRGNQADLRAKG